MKSVILIILISITSYSIHAQSLEQTGKVDSTYMNAIIITPGLFVIYPTITFQYERVLAVGKAGRFFGISLGGGVIYDGQTRFTLIYPRAYWLIGKQSSKLELAIGGALLLEWGYEVQGAVLPAIVVGYRYQKPSQRFLFRVGLAIPEGIYAGVGFRF